MADRSVDRPNKYRSESFTRLLMVSRPVPESLSQMSAQNFLGILEALEDSVGGVEVISFSVDVPRCSLQFLGATRYPSDSQSR